MFLCRILVASLVFSAGSALAWSQPLTELGRNADVVAFAAIDGILQQSGGPNATATIQLRLIQVLKGQPASSLVVATISSQCYGGGSGPMRLCAYFTPDMIGQTGVWFLKTDDAGYRILPRSRATRAGEIFLPLADPPGRIAGDLTDTLLACQVRWFQALVNPHYRYVDMAFDAEFDRTNSGIPTQRQVLAAIQPLIDSPYPGQHAAGLVIALRAGSSDAIFMVENELSALIPNPRLSEIVSAIGEVPAAQMEDPRWLGALRQLIDLHAHIPGMDAAVAAALYRIGTRETLPLLAELLDSPDAGAQMIVVRTLSIYTSRADAQGNAGHSGAAGPLYTDETRGHSPGGRDVNLTTPEFVAFWKSWWAANRARMGFPAEEAKARPAARIPSQPLPPPFINHDGIVRSDTGKPGILPPGISISIYGHNFGPATGCGGPAPEVCGVRVLLGGKPVEILYVNAEQVNARIPAAVPGGSTSLLTVVSGGRTSDPYEVRRLP